MTVVEGWFCGKKYATPPSTALLPAAVFDEIVNNICLNSKAFYIEEAGKKTEFVGNRTECALLMLSQRDWATPYEAVRKQHAEAVVNVRASLAAALLLCMCCGAAAHVPDLCSAVRIPAWDPAAVVRSRDVAASGRAR